MGPQRVLRHRGPQWRGHLDCVQHKETRDKDNEDDNKRLHY